MSPAERATWEAIYRVLISAVVLIARMLGKPCPVVTRDERRNERLTSGDRLW